MDSISICESESEEDSISSSSGLNCYLIDEISPLIKNIDPELFREPIKGNSVNVSDSKDWRAYFF